MAVEGLGNWGCGRLGGHRRFFWGLGLMPKNFYERNPFTNDNKKIKYWEIAFNCMKEIPFEMNRPKTKLAKKMKSQAILWNKSL